MLGLSPTEGFENLLKGPAQSIRELSPHIHGVPEHLSPSTLRTRQSQDAFSVCPTQGLLAGEGQLRLGERLCSVNNYTTLDSKLHKSSPWTKQMTNLCKL